MGTAYVGSDVVFLLGPGGAQKDISGDGNTCKVGFTRDVHETPKFGAGRWKAYIYGDTGAQIDFNGWFDHAADHADAINFDMLDDDAAKAFELRTLGTGATKPVLTGNLLIKKHEYDPKVNAAIPFTSSYQCTGTVTRGTQV